MAERTPAVRAAILLVLIGGMLAAFYLWLWLLGVCIAQTL